MERQDLGMELRHVCKLGVAAVAVSFVFCGCGKGDEFYDKGMEYMESGDYEEAGQQFQNAVEEDDSEAKYHIAYGMALNYSGRYEEALKELEEGSSGGKLSDGESKQIFYGQAVAHYGLGSYESAVLATEKALEIKEKPGLDSAVRNIKAAAYELSGDSDAALALYEENIKEDGKDKESYLRSGRLQLSKGQYDAAMEDFNKVIDIDKHIICWEMIMRRQTVMVRRQRKNQRMQHIIKGFCL